MPMYDYKCSCGRTFTRFLKMADYREPQICVCGKEAVKQLSAPAVRGDYPGYECPVTGNWIEGRRAHEENLARHNCRILEPGEREAVTRHRKAEEEKLENSIASTAEEFVEKLPTKKREQLAAELTNGADITVERQ